MDGGEDEGLGSQIASIGPRDDEEHSQSPNSTEGAALPDKTGIQSAIEGADESSRLRELDAHIRDQDDLERDIGRQVRSTAFRFQGDSGSNIHSRPTGCSWSRLTNGITRG